jgi:multiple sugar transport system permease protein/sn-glycerol 3-phosphate transport system permease protein
MTFVTPVRRKNVVRGARELVAIVPFLLPSLLLFAVFVFYPLGRSVWLGFHATDPFGKREVFVGVEQFQDVLTSPDFRYSLFVTGQFALYTVIPATAVGLFLALLAHQRLPGIIFFRTVFSSTIASSVAVTSVMWLLLLNPSVGVLNYVLDRGGLPTTNWLTDPDWALPAVAMTTVWMNVGFATIWAFQSFGQIHILTQGGPLDSTNVIVYSIYREAFLHFNVGLASAQAVVLFVIVLLLTLLQFGIAQRWVFYR